MSAPRSPRATRPVRRRPAPAERLLALAGGTPTTIAGHGPSLPRLKPRWRALSRACGSGQSLRLWYGSAEEPPVELAVAPQLLYSAGERGYLEAECLATGTIKTYRLDRIQRVLEGR